MLGLTSSKVCNLTIQMLMAKMSSQWTPRSCPCQGPPAVIIPTAFSLSIPLSALGISSTCSVEESLPSFRKARTDHHTAHVDVLTSPLLICNSHVVYHVLCAEPRPASHEEKACPCVKSSSNYVVVSIGRSPDVNLPSQIGWNTSHPKLKQWTSRCHRVLEKLGKKIALHPCGFTGFY